MSVKNVLLCGLGAVGLTFGSKILANTDVNLKVLVDDERYERYTKNPLTLNGKEKIFNYIKPNENYKPDLIIIATKAHDLDNVLNMLSNFVNNKVIIISLINGISSEEIISNRFPQAKVLKSFFIGHSAVRVGNSVTQDGVGEIVCEKNIELAEFFTKSNIKFSNPENVDYSMWLKYTFNLVSNQLSAILNMTFGELKNNIEFKNFAPKVINEIKTIATYKGIQNLENLENDFFKFLDRMCDDGKTSMLQDILAKRKTEVDIFAGEIIKLGKCFNVATPYNNILYDLIKMKEETNEHSIHTC